MFSHLHCLVHLNWILVHVCICEQGNCAETLIPGGSSLPPGMRVFGSSVTALGNEKHTLFDPLEKNNSAPEAYMLHFGHFIEFVNFECRV